MVSWSWIRWWWWYGMTSVLLTEGLALAQRISSHININSFHPREITSGSNGIAKGIDWSTRKYISIQSGGTWGGGGEEEDEGELQLTPRQTEQTCFLDGIRIQHNDWNEIHNKIFMQQLVTTGLNLTLYLYPYCHISLSLLLLNALYVFAGWCLIRLLLQVLLKS